MTTATVPIPDNPIYRRMRDGHRIRCGHELTGHLDVRAGYAVLVRTCCADDTEAKGG